MVVVVVSHTHMSSMQPGYAYKYTNIHTFLHMYVRTRVCDAVESTTNDTRVIVSHNNLCA